MSDFWRDPELNQLVHEINQTDARSPSRSLSLAPLPTEPTAALALLLQTVTEKAASDLVLLSGSRPILRIHGSLEPLGDAEISASEMTALFGSWFNERRLSELETRGAADFSIRHADRRFRVNIHRQRGELAAAIRALPPTIPTLEELNLPPTLAKLVEPTAGLVLVCGPTGSGKSSTLAALVGEINRRFTRHIVTIEDPIEFEHANDRSVIEQIEVGTDSPSFAAALRSVLRQDADVILVGEMRDLETMSTAVTAAETGHLILATLHTGDATQAIRRIIDVFPAAQQAQIRHQLAMSLSAIVSQQLLPRADGRARVPAVEVLIANDAVRNHVRGERLQNIPSEITLGKRAGMISLEESLANLVRRGAVSNEEARARSRRPDEFESILRS